MKRLISLLLCLALLCALASCSSKATASATKPEDTSAKEGAEEDADDAQEEGADASDETEAASAADIYTWIAKNDSYDYTIPEKSLDFMEENPKFFPGSEKNTGAMSDFIDYDADYPHVAKSPAKYADKLMHVYGQIVDCKEEETVYGTITFLQIVDYAGDSYCMYYLGELADAFEDDYANANVLPFGTITFENVGAYYTQAVIGAACYVVVDGYDYDDYYDDYGDDYYYGPNSRP